MVKFGLLQHLYFRVRVGCHPFSVHCYAAEKILQQRHISLIYYLSLLLNRVEQSVYPSHYDVEVVPMGMIRLVHLRLQYHLYYWNSLLDFSELILN